MGKTARNELKKLKAGWYNSVSAAFVTVGVLAPTVARIVGGFSSSMDETLVAVVSVICLPASAVLHFAGRAELMELEE
ncbi:hypothetical protein [Tardiphaga sp.]|jgi:hypothetical protein|uniref:hypothetical protein n=1 Tax=Tardiphaga sp. TaxID=1926292 RepID=UPI0037DA27DF